jgi:hypothetical protein
MKQILIIIAILLFAGIVIFLLWFHGASPQYNIIQRAEASDGFMGTLAGWLRTDAAERDLLQAAPIYDGNEEAFWITAKEMPTFLAQLEVAKEVVKSSAEFPYTSDKLSLPKEYGFDQWGRPFCVTGDKQTIVILSTGGADLNLKCRSKINTEKMKQLPRNKTFKTQTGYYAMLVDRP